MSQNADIGRSFTFCQKTGRILLFLNYYFSRFHKIKTRTYIKINHISMGMCNLMHGESVLKEIFQLKMLDMETIVPPRVKNIIKSNILND